MRDPRPYQIATLALLLAYGLTRLAFDVPAPHVVLILGTALLTQRVLTDAWGLPRFDPRSALISGLSLCLLLRTGSPWLAAAAALAAVTSKFVIRWNGKHLFNPTNFGLVAMMSLTRGVWVSPGQWGHSALFAFLMACLGGVVVFRAWRSDVTVAFLAAYASMLVGRALLLGDPLSIPLHQLQSGALLLFSFFMISDPKTTPDSRRGRIVFAVLVAAGAWYVQFRLFRPSGILWSLAACSAVVPLLDRLFPARRYAWAAEVSGPWRPEEGVLDVAQMDLRGGGAGPVRGGEDRLRLLRLLRGQG
jgi:Na+-translocating ferredoxin:NAD+ oxidoreductase RnfD subunit